jgi:hypothetical protein
MSIYGIQGVVGYILLRFDTSVYYGILGFVFGGIIEYILLLISDSRGCGIYSMCGLFGVVYIPS